MTNGAAERREYPAPDTELPTTLVTAQPILRTLVQSAFDSAANDDSPYGRAAHLHGRMQAISCYDRAIDAESGIDLELLARDELRAFQFGYAPGIMVEGPEVRLRPETGRFVALALHELATNSIKFGMLGRCGADAALRVTWAFRNDGLELAWQESGVAVLATLPARRKGFGQTLIEDILPRHLGAACRFTLVPGGVECAILLPAQTFEI